MSRQSTIRPDGQWYKGNTHAHTHLSDGVLSPADLVERYRALDYDFTAITDHRTYGVHEKLSTTDFLVLPGVELDVRAAGGQGFCHHVVGLGLPGKNRLTHGQRIEYADDVTGADLVALLTRQGNFCIYAHPAWSHVRHEVMDSIDGFTGMEIYNNTCEVNSGCGFSDSWYDRMLWQGRKIWCIASDDTHQHAVDYGGGFIMVKASSLTHAAIMDGLQAGSFFASQGPLIQDFYVEAGQVHLLCSPCRSIGFQNDSNPGFAVNDDAGNLTATSYKLSGQEQYVRAVCVDTAGKKAWTQPIWLKES